MTYEVTPTQGLVPVTMRSCPSDYPSPLHPPTFPPEWPRHAGNPRAGTDGWGKDEGPARSGTLLGGREGQSAEFVRTWVDLEGILLTEISQTEKHRFRDFTHTWDLKANKTHRNHPTHPVVERREVIVEVREVTGALR